ncbi:hypothetical protein PVK06_047958 [Gossypium arboreum]|uniref:MULE transposase domain-containing protein n=1 Tax=Gossypium arboreum TaxID=29729 RepID=A0ABR0MER8_GOSAR|nr:hypothetical protein PVK06_047958 [Gossypium arboreum]
MDSDMFASLILQTLKANPKTSVPVLIANIHSQLKYMPSYRKVWIAKQKALENMHGRWDASYNEVWQWCQVMKRYVPGCITDLDTTTTDCSVDAKCSSVCSGALSNVETHLYTASHWLRRHVCPQPDICIISDRGTGILATIERQGSQWHRTHHQYCLRHVASNYYREAMYGARRYCERLTRRRHEPTLCT